MYLCLEWCKRTGLLLLSTKYKSAASNTPRDEIMDSTKKGRLFCPYSVTVLCGLKEKVDASLLHVCALSQRCRKSQPPQSAIKMFFLFFCAI